MKILDLFIRKHYEELTASDVEALADVSQSTFHRNIDELEMLGVIEQTGTTGNTKTFKLNKDSELAKALASAHADILEHATQILDSSQSQATVEIVSSVENSIEQDDQSHRSDRTDKDEVKQQVARAITG
ncbi:winged helix-turn-helix transcriptional regulator [Natronolimnobius sp. AArcel1]|nr:winged helix-turn-helix transcriptional regulator [Natronolimnobius sp. AArcel1]